MIRLTTKFVCLFVILFFSSSIYPQKINSIEINNSRVFSSDNYINWSGINIGSKIYPGLMDSAKNRISRKLIENGYLNFDFLSDTLIFSADSQKADVKLTVKEGEPTYVDKINFSGLNKNDSLIIIPQFEFVINSIIDKNAFEETIASILNYYEENGYPFTAVKIESFYLHTDSSSGKNLAEINLLLQKGENSTINKIEILGNTKTKDYVIERAIRLEKNELYSQSQVSEIPKKLNRLRFFEPVEIPGYYINSDNEGVLQIKIKEKNTNNFDGIIGYVPESSDGGKGYFTGFVNISLRNIFGTGRSAAIKWQQEDRNSQELELKYIEPWLLGFPFNIGLELYQRKQDTTYVQRKFEARIEYLATESISASVLLATESTIPTLSPSSGFTVFNSTSFTSGINLTINTTDDFYAPTEGINFINTYRFSQKRIHGPEEFITAETATNINLQRLELDFGFFYQLFNRQIIAVGMHGRELRGPAFEFSDLYRLGGTYTLRGYREKQFAGNRVAWSNFEYRYLLSKRTFAFLFLDTGYYLRNEDAEKNITRTEGFKIGYGIGLNIETGIGVLGVNFALAKGDSFADGKIHFGIINDF